MEIKTIDAFLSYATSQITIFKELLKYQIGRREVGNAAYTLGYLSAYCQIEDDLLALKPKEKPNGN